MAKGKRGSKAMNVLFIGNSFTARNDVPASIAQLAAARGKQLQHRLIWAGGASLRAHWNKGEALTAIRDGKYDAVVLQEQSTLPIKNAGRMHENIRLFDTAIRSAGAKTFLYMTWARRTAPESQNALTEAYTIIGRELGATTTGRSCTTRTRAIRARPGAIWPRAFSWRPSSAKARSGSSPRCPACRVRT
jgi:hypothetical protein